MEEGRRENALSSGGRGEGGGDALPLPPPPSPPKPSRISPSGLLLPLLLLLFRPLLRPREEKLDEKFGSGGDARPVASAAGALEEEAKEGIGGELDPDIEDPRINS